LVALTVDNYQVLGDVRERRDRGVPATNDGSGATFGENLSGNNQLVVIQGCANIAHAISNRRVGLDGESTLDPRGSASLANPGRICSVSEKQTQRGHHHGLSSSGFTGDNGESRTQG
jgi:hypothetical protein